MSEETLAVPQTLIKGQSGYAMDIGGSVIKLVYIKEVPGSASAHLHFKCYPSDQLQEALNFIKDNCNQEDKIYTAGVGSYQHADFIKRTLAINHIENLNEFVCFLKAFRFLTSNLPMVDVVHPPSQVVREYADDFRQQFMGVKQKDSELGASEGGVKTDPIWKGLGEGAWRHGQEDQSGTDVVHIPCVLATLGSGAGIVHVKEEEWNLVDGITRCGRMFLGLGSLLTGSTGFNQLVQLAEAGDASKVNVLGAQLKTGDPGNLYNNLPDSLMFYCFGNAKNRDLDSFRREDLAAGLLSTICSDLVSNTHRQARLLGCDTVYFCGSFCGESYKVRDELGKGMEVRNTMLPMGQKPVRYHFLRFGGYLGALGALLHHLQQ